MNSHPDPIPSVEPAPPPPPQPAAPTLRLSELLEREIENLQGSAPQLAKDINTANGNAGHGYKVDYRQLLKIRDNPGGALLSLDLLIALNEYFKLKGEGLTKLPILASRGLMDLLFDANRLVFMVGAKPRPSERRIDWSRWDALGLAHLVGAASSRERRPEFQIEDILWRKRVDLSAIKSEKWHSLLEKEETSVISIGSPTAALSSEYMLAHMFGVPKFQHPQYDPNTPGPFYFAWLPRAAQGFQSAFGLTAKALEAIPKLRHLAPRVRTNRASAFVLQGEAHVVPAKGKSWTMYGIIAAQRYPSGCVWLVVSGLAGPATLAAAKLAQSIDVEIPVATRQNPSVLWMPIKAIVKTGHPSSVVSGDLRDLVDYEPASKPMIWSPNDRIGATGPSVAKGSSSFCRTADGPHSQQVN